MSHSQFRCIKTYTETCMDESLRQAYDYWQDQPGSIRKRFLTLPLGNAFFKQCDEHYCKLTPTFVSEAEF